ncbi:MAG: phosphatidate cytidylyltransferase [Candidatus Cloacimonetes bacterium]|nr:phosphatidate cytidylyltransferase [Candidatus Cloacimonadota bacterium]MDD2506659.1 phosphatidate cytidylyltransferase [Candidatus Cloacimonadota bacterium]MDD4560275.1 phosphatidate cytidylyltransferase [Candidatus Cloacimonadota bacterium]
MMSELSKRVLVSIFFIPVLILALYFEGIPLYLMFLLVSLMGSQEYIAMMRKAGICIPWLWVIINPLLYSLWLLFPKWEIGLLLTAFIAAMLEVMFDWEEQKSVPRLFANLFGTVYTALMPAMIVKIALLQPESKILLALILMIWIVDSCAYFVGMRFGKRRGITQVSPRKSLEGFVAGLLAPALISFMLYIGNIGYFTPTQLVLLALAAGVFGQLGDLLESMLKRFCNVKDSSKLIPGHGGILDRTDSILLAGSFLYTALLAL